MAEAPIGVEKIIKENLPEFPVINLGRKFGKELEAEVMPTYYVGVGEPKEKIPAADLKKHVLAGVKQRVIERIAREKKAEDARLVESMTPIQAFSPAGPTPEETLQTAIDEGRPVTAEEVIASPETNQFEKILAGAKVAAEQAVNAQSQERSALKRAVNRFLYPVSIPIGAAVASGTVSPETVKETFKLGEALMPVTMAPGAPQAMQAVKENILGKIVSRLPKFEVPAPTTPPVAAEFKLPTPPVVPYRRAITGTVAGEPITSPTIPGPPRTFAVGPTQDWLKDAVEVELNKMPAQLRDRYRELYGKMANASDPESAFKMIFEKDPVGPAKVSNVPFKIQRTVTAGHAAAKPMPAGTPVTVQIPGAANPQVLVTGQATPPQIAQALRGATRGPSGAGPAAPPGGTIPPGGTTPPTGAGPIFAPPPPGANPPTTYWNRAVQLVDNLSGGAISTLKKRLPADPAIAKQAPNSWALPLFENFQVNTANFMGKLADSAWWKKLNKLTDDQIKGYESQMVRYWQANGRNDTALAAAIQQTPPEIQAYMLHRMAQTNLEAQARRYLGLAETDYVAGPYIPRMLERDLPDLFSVKAGGNTYEGQVRQSLSSFAKARTHDTQLAGELAGTVYAPVKHAIAVREYTSTSLIETAKLMKRLEDARVIFRTKADAMASTPRGVAFPVQGLPGHWKQWWTGSKAEGQFLVDNLSHSAYNSPLTAYNHLATTLFRNTNLFNPLPHVTKNMGVKYLISGGSLNPVRFLKDWREYNQGVKTGLHTPELAEFLKYFPHNKYNTTARAVLSEFTAEGKVAPKIYKMLSYITKPSSTYLFGHADPAMRFSLWKKHLEKTIKDPITGIRRQITPVEAANHVHVDLIRYGARSELLDYWASMPFNFYTPWRVGSVTSVLKQIKNHPLRTAAIIGVIDYTREAIYRNTGMWTHLPYDYVSGPIAQFIENAGKGPGQGAFNAAMQVASTRFFGPSGGAAGQTITDGLKLLSGENPEEWERIKNLFWGTIVLTAGVPHLKEGIVNGDWNKLAQGMSEVILGSHEAMTYSPHRFTKWIPEGALPGMTRTQPMQESKRVVEALERRREHSLAKRQHLEEKFGKGAARRILQSKKLIEPQRSLSDFGRWLVGEE